MNLDRRKRTKYLLYVGLLVTTVWCVNNTIGRWRHLDNTTPHTSTVYGQHFQRGGFKDGYSLKIASFDEQMDRIKRLKRECSKPELFNEWIFKKSSNIESQYYYSHNYSLTYCKVPKTGCTFWKQMIFVLEMESYFEWENIFQKGRDAVHIRSFRKKFLVPFESEERKNSKTVIGSRDPYSRLYSAYIDKVYLGGLPHETFRIASYANKSRSENVTSGNLPRARVKACLDSVSFSDFLKYVINEVLSGHNLEEHWVPITTLCRPCDINDILLAKQESFSDNVEYALEVLNVDNKKKNYLEDVLHKHKVDHTLPALVPYIAALARRTFRCLSTREIWERIWRSFQIQGYIDDNISFPMDESLSLNHVTAARFTKIVLDTMSKYPLNSTQSKNQRHIFLVDAYRTVDMNTFKMIRQIYAPDFRLFGYSNDPPGKQEQF